MSQNPQPSPRPLIPSSFLGLDVPTQRWYAIAIGLLLQALKLADLLIPPVVSVVSSTATLSSRTYYLFKWIATDAIFVFGLPRLRLPKLTFAWQASCLQFLLLSSCNYLLFGPWSSGFVAHLPSMPSILARSGSEVGVQGNNVQMEKVIQGSGHLQGQHTVLLSPISTIHLNPYGEHFCISPSHPVVRIPILFNNSLPTSFTYNHQAIGSASTSTKTTTVKKLDPISDPEADADDDDDDPKERITSFPSLGPSESMRLLQIRDTGNFSIKVAGDSRVRSGKATVVECPTASFAKLPPSRRCEGDSDEVTIKVKGVPPLSLDYIHQVRGRREQLVIEGIDGELNRRQVLEVNVPITINHTTLGSHSYALTSIADVHGNTQHLNDSATITVMQRAAYSFRDCKPGRDASLLIGANAHINLRVQSKDNDPHDAPWAVTIIHDNTGKAETVVTEPNQRDIHFRVNDAGSYTISRVQGAVCPGIVLSPETCRVVQEPFPYVNVTWSRIHECSGDTGVTASLMLHGKPPFQVGYKTKHNSNPHRTSVKTFSGSRGEITLQPEDSGHHEYILTDISDANYKGIPIENSRIEQTVRALASAYFARASSGSRGGLQVNSCEGSTVEIEAGLKGTPPWTLEIQVASARGSETVIRSNLADQREKLQLPIPSDIDREGGAFQIDLVSVQDAQGCKRTITEPGVSVNVRRVKATAKFYTDRQQRRATILEGETASLPLRLTGDGPWKLQYTHSDRPLEVKTVGVSSANDALKVTKPGKYTIQNIRDSYCDGLVIAEESVYDVSWIPRPSISLVSSDTISLSSSQDVYVKKPVCEGVDDSFDVELEGRPPFQVKYSTASRFAATDPAVDEKSTFSSIQKRSKIVLDTSKAGSMSYKIEEIGDASYPLSHALKTKHSGSIKLQQRVIARPRAYFSNSDGLVFCLNDALVPKDSDMGAGTITLIGQPPFYLALSIHNLNSAAKTEERVKLWEHEWKVSVPHYHFETTGTYLVTIDTILDDSGCVELVDEPHIRSLRIDVAETAALLPYESRQDFCVGDLLRFQLQGTPPWNVKYLFNGHPYSASTADPLFRRVADKAGNFNVVSLAHQSNMCPTIVSNIEYAIHDLPSAWVSHGKRFTENIQEGEQAEIVFNLAGEPPFTFTYQRTELTSGKKSAPGKVLETHTVSGIKTNEHSIFTSQEGTWTVTFIADKYCKYPASSQVGSTEKLLTQ